MRITDDQPAVITPGISVTPKPILNEPGGKFFGWIDHAGDENTFAFDEILGAIKQPELQGGRYLLIVKGLSSPIPITQDGYYRLLRKMGWTDKERIARVS
jgi:hypothetical protein